jgi:hypothetical protein
MKEFLNGVIKPYLDFVRRQPGFLIEATSYPQKMRALLISDHHWSHEDQEVVDLCTSMQIDIDFVYPGATDLFSVLDVGINKPVKQFLKQKFEGHCSTEIFDALQKGILPGAIKLDLKLSTLKPVASLWIIEAYAYISQQHGLVRRSWNQVCKNITKIRPDFDHALEIPDEEDQQSTYVKDCFSEQRRYTILETQRLAKIHLLPTPLTLPTPPNPQNLPSASSPATPNPHHPSSSPSTPNLHHSAPPAPAPARARYPLTPVQLSASSSIPAPAPASLVPTAASLSVSSLLQSNTSRTMITATNTAAREGESYTIHPDEICAPFSAVTGRTELDRLETEVLNHTTNERQLLWFLE